MTSTSGTNNVAKPIKQDFALEGNQRLFIEAIKQLSIPLRAGQVSLVEIGNALAKDGAGPDEIVVLEAVILVGI